MTNWLRLRAVYAAGWVPKCSGTHPAVRMLCVRVLAVVYELQIHLKVCRLEHRNNILQIIT